ncbi:MAG TPA: hypothetical protein PKW55_02200 [Spirochaetota bacterium]|nr:hypothetical protein [Spirochaetota bacterium]HOM38339.1 hypothetical protein [Spirochaetota bacterium]HPQ48443.1 hypothetical protein [Spirochaetota bacterium]
MPFYKIEGAKFKTMEELKESLWQLYKDKMSREDFEKYVQEKVEVVEG